MSDCGRCAAEQSIARHAVARADAAEHELAEARKGLQWWRDHVAKLDRQCSELEARQLEARIGWAVERSYLLTPFIRPGQQWGRELWLAAYLVAVEATLEIRTTQREILIDALKRLTA